MGKRDHERTVFTSQYGLYQFASMPFEICSASLFAARNGRNTVYNEVAISACKLYDIAIFSRTLEEHMKHTEIALELLKDDGVAL